MGNFFSRPGRESDALPPGAFSAGNISSLDSSSITPYLGINTGSYEDPYPPIPFEWIVSPSNVNDGSCPNGSQILTWFGVTDVIITLLAILCAYRPFVHWIARGKLGNRRKNRLALTWTITFACQLTASAIVAGIIGNTSGYESLNMLHIFTVAMSRPRFYPIVLGLLRCVVTSQRTRDWDKTTIIKRSVDDRVEFTYTDAWITTSFSELLLLLISAVFTGVTWHRLPSDSKSREYASDHVSFVSSTPGIMFLCMLAFLPIYKRYGEAYPIEGRRYETGRYWGVTISNDGRTRIGVKKDNKKTAVKRGANALCAVLLLAYVALVQWAYWTRLLEMSGVLFCPPKMIESGVVWVVFTAVGFPECHLGARWHIQHRTEEERGIRDAIPERNLVDTSISSIVVGCGVTNVPQWTMFTMGTGENLSCNYHAKYEVIVEIIIPKKVSFWLNKSRGRDITGIESMESTHNR
ncbi:hypothetical protein EDB82DRAFT_473716 [Fusarium venenatum]|uniref:uncharacterized protein n=1 Tax=Fusarium venenatum TaxID=56646 RepID=UPI001D3A311D|nr:hypothetical protein EDB82DRAFT_473716 [Fusarium venenatum]